jgi:UDP-N-acetylmuramoyl-L-alanyl-D-glutamate--2,6-diaminopimelate ligase
MFSESLSSIVNRPILGSDRLVRGLSLDSRTIKKDYLFFAVKGELQDGHDFIDQAIVNGATSIVLENDEYIQDLLTVSYVVISNLKDELGDIASRFYHSPTKKMSVIGVTGTNGKTSITHYISQLYTLLGSTAGVIGTLGIEFGNKHIDSNNTTPDAVTLQHSFSLMLEAGTKSVAMEVSSHALNQQRCNGISFDTAIISNITHDHLDYHGSFDAYLGAKKSLFTKKELRVAIINFDDANADKFIDAVGLSVKVITYSLENSKANLFLSEIQQDTQGYSAKLHYSDFIYPIEIPLMGIFNIYNVLAALIALVEQNYAVESVIGAVKNIKPVQGRMELVANQQKIIAVVDYAHTPDALKNVLSNLRQQISGRLIVVFGCGGDRDKFKRPIMASIASEYADYVFITSDNPRSESPNAIIADIVSGIVGDNYQIVIDRDKAILAAVNIAAENDCVLVAGKGHEKFQIIGSEKLPFDDVLVLRRALKSREVGIC